MTNKLVSLFEIIFLSFSCLVFCYMVQAAAQKNFLALLFLPIIFYIIYLFKNKNINIKLPDKKSNIWFRLYGALWIINFIMLFVFAFSLETELSWDWKWVIEGAGNYVSDHIRPSRLYFARYPNNQFITYIFIIFFKTLSFFNKNTSMEDMKAASIILNCIVIQISVSFLYLSALALFDRKKAFGIGIISMLYTPLFLYSFLAYTDTFSLMFSSALLYLFIKLNKSRDKKKICLYCVLTGITAAVGKNFKLTVLIVFVAFVICLLFDQRKKIGQKFLQLAVSAVSLLICLLIISVPVRNFFNITPQEKDKYEFPPFHWIMMSLNPIGGYDPQDVEYTAQFQTYEERKEHDIEMIGKRVEEYGIRKLTNHIFYTKLYRTWTNPALAGDDYINRKPIHKDNFLSNLFRLNGKYYYWFYSYISAVHLLILAGCILSSIKILRHKNYNWSIIMCQLAVFGVALFLCIWECNSRYLFTFIPMLLFTSFYGYKHYSPKISSV